MGWFDFLWRRPEQPPSAVVSFDDDGIKCQRWNGPVESVNWSELRAVIIRTTSDGPFLDDVSWILVGNSADCVVPGEAAGMDRLVKRLIQLPNFDMDAFSGAMACTDDHEFHCWQRAADS